MSSHHDNHGNSNEKKPVSFQAPLIFALVITLIILAFVSIGDPGHGCHGKEVCSKECAKKCEGGDHSMCEMEGCHPGEGHEEMCSEECEHEKCEGHMEGHEAKCSEEGCDHKLCGEHMEGMMEGMMEGHGAKCAEEGCDHKHCGEHMEGKEGHGEGHMEGKEEAHHDSKSEEQSGEHH